MIITKEELTELSKKLAETGTRDSELPEGNPTDRAYITAFEKAAPDDAIAQYKTNLKNTIEKYSRVDAEVVSVESSDTAAANVKLNNGKLDFSFSLPKGEKGLPGAKGDTGAVGATGSQGPVGPVGPKGSTGPQGLQGPQGVAGPKGETGETGAKGPQGIQGIPGVAGAKGDKGDTGAQGIPGIKGATGSQGVQGPIGPIGPKGDKGDKGNTGETGKPFKIEKKYPTISAMNADFNNPLFSLNDIVMLSPTDITSEDYGKLYMKGLTSWEFFVDIAVQGIQGPKGDTGTQGIQGPKGSIGAVGPQGPQGIQGPKGDTGLKGDIGPIGPVGPKGDVGATGAQGLKGDTGARGPQGIQGIQGEKGIQGLTGPTGSQGIPGAQGPVGATGPVGPKGEQGIQGIAGESAYDAALIGGYVAPKETFYEDLGSLSKSTYGSIHTAYGLKDKIGTYLDAAGNTHTLYQHTIKLDPIQKKAIEEVIDDGSFMFNIDSLAARVPDIVGTNYLVVQYFNDSGYPQRSVLCSNLTFADTPKGIVAMGIRQALPISNLWRAEILLVITFTQLDLYLDGFFIGPANEPTTTSTTVEIYPSIRGEANAYRIWEFGKSILPEWEILPADKIVHYTFNDSIPECKGLHMQVYNGTTGTQSNIAFNAVELVAPNTWRSVVLFGNHNNNGGVTNKKDFGNNTYRNYVSTTSGSDAVGEIVTTAGNRAADIQTYNLIDSGPSSQWDHVALLTKDYLHPFNMRRTDTQTKGEISIRVDAPGRYGISLWAGIDPTVTSISSTKWDYRITSSGPDKLILMPELLDNNIEQGVMSISLISDLTFTITISSVSIDSNDEHLACLIGSLVIEKLS